VKLNVSILIAATLALIGVFLAIRLLTPEKHCVHVRCHHPGFDDRALRASPPSASAPDLEALSI
jgi:hypothetical protein